VAWHCARATGTGPPVRGDSLWGAGWDPKPCSCGAPSVRQMDINKTGRNVGWADNQQADRQTEAAKMLEWLSPGTDQMREHSRSQLNTKFPNPELPAFALAAARIALVSQKPRDSASLHCCAVLCSSGCCSLTAQPLSSRQEVGRAYRPIDVHAWPEGREKPESRDSQTGRLSEQRPAAEPCKTHRSKILNSVSMRVSRAWARISSTARSAAVSSSSCIQRGRHAIRSRQTRWTATLHV
jgi:hypothetical protein